jgi:ASC-1-like (ASCH) protein
MKEIRKKFLADTGVNINTFLYQYTNREEVHNYIDYLETLIEKCLVLDTIPSKVEEAEIKLDKMGKLLFIKRVQQLMTVKELDNYDEYKEFLENIPSESYSNFLASYETNSMDELLEYWRP